MIFCTSIHLRKPPPPSHWPLTFRWRWASYACTANHPQCLGEGEGKRKRTLSGMFAKVWNIFWKVMKINFDKIRDMFLQSLYRKTWTRKHPIPSTFLTPFCSTSVAQASWYDAKAMRPGRPKTETANHSTPWSHHRPPFRRPSGRWPTKTTGCRLGPVRWNIVFHQMVLRLSSVTPRKHQPHAHLDVYSTVEGDP